MNICVVCLLRAWHDCCCTERVKHRLDLLTPLTQAAGVNTLKSRETFLLPTSGEVGTRAGGGWTHAASQVTQTGWRAVCTTCARRNEDTLGKLKQ